ncbi:MAG: peptidoglycan-binding protein [Actinomycetota bacterium]|nr:peptidoglycan-binding protein [Actinomycetota bacterium]
MDILKKNHSGEKIVDLQMRLKKLGYDLGDTQIDGFFGLDTENAVKKFQQERGLDSTGIVDGQTWQELVDAGYKIGDRLLYLKHPPFRGDDVRTLQYWLKSLGFYRFKENGIFCPNTHDAVIEFQKNMNLAADAIVGDGTIKHLLKLKRIIEPKKTSNFPFNSRLELRKRQGMVAVAIDYGHDINEQESEQYFKEKIYICKSIANYCKQFLGEKGIRSIITVNDDNQSLFLTDRIHYANKTGSDILVSINLSYSREHSANGCSSYYFKGLRSYSVNGSKIANSIQDMVVQNLGLRDCRVHGSSYSILKETEMTSVLVEPGFISNREQRKKLKQSSYQRRLSTNLSQGIINFIKS